MLTPLEPKQRLSWKEVPHAVGLFRRAVRIPQSGQEIIYSARMNLNPDVLNRGQWGVAVGREEYQGGALRPLRREMGVPVSIGQLDNVPGAEVWAMQVPGGYVISMQEPTGHQTFIYPEDPNNTSKVHQVTRYAPLENECALHPYTGQPVLAARSEAAPRMTELGLPENRVADVMYVYTKQAWDATHGSMNALIAMNINLNSQVVRSVIEGGFCLAYTMMVEDLPDGANSGDILAAAIDHPGITQMMRERHADFVQVIVAKVNDNVGGRGQMGGSHSLVTVDGFKWKSGAHELAGHGLGMDHDVKHAGGVPPAVLAMLAADPDLEFRPEELHQLLVAHGCTKPYIFGSRHKTRKTCTVTAYTKGGFLRETVHPSIQNGRGSVVSDAPQELNQSFPAAVERNNPTNAAIVIPKPTGTRIFLPIMGN